MQILLRLREKTQRYGELKKTMNKVTNSMLTLSLRELENDGFIARTVYHVVHPKVEYSLEIHSVKCQILVKYHQGRAIRVERILR
jgi:DNA-binding HxlR family transcriptional regulator